MRAVAGHRAAGALQIAALGHGLAGAADAGFHHHLVVHRQAKLRRHGLAVVERKRNGAGGGRHAQHGQWHAWALHWPREHEQGVSRCQLGLQFGCDGDLPTHAWVVVGGGRWVGRGDLDVFCGHARCATGLRRDACARGFQAAVQALCKRAARRGAFAGALPECLGRHEVLAAIGRAARQRQRLGVTGVNLQSPVDQAHGFTVGALTLQQRQQIGPVGEQVGVVGGELDGTLVGLVGIGKALAAGVRARQHFPGWGIRLLAGWATLQLFGHLADHGVDVRIGHVAGLLRDFILETHRVGLTEPDVQPDGQRRHRQQQGCGRGGAVGGAHALVRGGRFVDHAPGQLGLRLLVFRLRELALGTLRIELGALLAQQREVGLLRHGRHSA